MWKYGLVALVAVVAIIGATGVIENPLSWTQTNDCGWNEVTHPETNETFSSIEEFEQALSEYQGEEITLTQEDRTKLEVRDGTLHQHITDCGTTEGSTQ